MKKSSHDTVLPIGVFILLGALTAFDSLSIDLYMPAFGDIARDLNVSQQNMPLTVSLFLLGLGLGQALCGPLADSLGRKRPLLAGIFLFVGASLLAALSPTMELFLAARFLQGLGGAAALVIPRALISDICPANKAPAIYTILMQIQSVSPVLAPLVGTVILLCMGWRAIFFLLTAVTALLFILSALRIRETCPSEKRIPVRFKEMLRGYIALICNARYLGMTLANGFLMAMLMGYICASASLFMGWLGLSPSGYSLLFACFSAGMIMAGQANLWLCKRTEQRRCIAIGFVVHLSLLLLFLVCAFLIPHAKWICVLVMFPAVGSNCMLYGGLMAESMYSVPPSLSGTASALLGLVQYATGAAAGALMGVLLDGTLFRPALIMTLCSLAALPCWIIAERKPLQKTL